MSERDRRRACCGRAFRRFRLPLREINDIEQTAARNRAERLFAVNFRIYVDPVSISTIASWVEGELSARQMPPRKWTPSARIRAR